MDFIKYFSQWIIDHFIIVILFVVPLIVIFWLIRTQLIPLLFKSQERRRSINHKLFQFKVLFWLLVVLVYMVFIVKTHSFSSLSVLGGLFLVGFHFFRNYFMGLYIRFEGKIKSGTVLRIDDLEGKVNSFKLTKIELMESKGNLLLLPYFELEKNGYIIVKHLTTQLKDEFIFPLEKEDFAQVETELRKYLMTNPWVLADQGIDIDYKDGIISVSLELMEKDARSKIKTELKRKLEIYLDKG